MVSYRQAACPPEFKMNQWQKQNNRNTPYKEQRHRAGVGMGGPGQPAAVISLPFCVLLHGQVWRRGENAPPFSPEVEVLVMVSGPTE